MQVIVVPHNENWKFKYQEESSKIKKIFDTALVDIFHIGSSSVVGLKAKPIIDIMPIVKDINNVDSFNEKMSNIGYLAKGEFGITGRRYFRKGEEIREVNVHVFQYNNSFEINRHLAVRDFLRVNSNWAFEYGELKEKLAKEFPEDIQGYMDGKDKFVKSLQLEALNWLKDNSKEYLYKI